MKTVDIVVPCFNEEEVLPEFVRVTNEVIATLPQYSFRYILVNDGSRDKTLLVMMKGTPLAYNKDMQEDKEAIFDAIDTVKLCLTTFIPMLSTMELYKENMRNAAARGFINATDCADYLVKKGLPFRDAYKITGTLVAYCIKNNTVLEKLSIDEFKALSDVFDGDVYEAISLETCVNMRKADGGPAPEAVKKQIAYARAAVK